MLGRIPYTALPLPLPGLSGNKLNSATFAKREFAVQPRQAPGADRVKSPSPHHRFVIAWYSPDGVIQTGLRMEPPEKKTPLPAYGAQRATFSSPVSEEELRNCGDFRRF